MRTVSRWDWKALRYDYFRVPGEASPGGWKPLSGLGIEPARGGDHGVGISIEDALPPLPEHAVLVGHGIVARGQIVRPERPAHAPEEALQGDEPPRKEHTVLAGFLMGLGVTLAMPLPAAVPTFLGGATLGWALGRAHEQDRRNTLSGVARVRRVFKVRAP